MEKQPDALNALLNSISKYMDTRPSCISLLLPLMNAFDNASEAASRDDSLKFLHSQVCSFASEKWTSDFIHSHSALCASPQVPYELASCFYLPPLDSFDLPFPLPSVPFKLFDACLEEGPEYYPPFGSIDRWILVENVTQIVNCYHSNHKSACEALLSLRYNVPFSIEKAILECLFGELLHLPEPLHKAPYYSLLIFDLCRQLRSFPKQLGKAIRTLYSMIPSLDYLIIDRLSSWFSHHLSNFDFVWKWEEWESQIQPASPSFSQKQFDFISQSIDKLVKLSYADRVRKVLPPSFHSLLPCYSTPSMSSIPCENVALIDQLKEKIVQQKATPAMLSEFLSTFEMSDEMAKQSVLLYTLLLVGSKTFSHTLTIFERYLSCFSLNPSLSLQVVGDFWKCNQQVKYH